MAKSKNTDIICIAVIVFTVVLTLLFMFGESLGLSVMADSESSGDMFTANDLAGDWDASGATVISLSGSGGSVRGNGAYISGGDVVIAMAGRYVISGDFEGCITVSADGDDKIWLMLDGVQLTNGTGPAINIRQARKVFLTLAEGSENSIRCGTGGDDAMDGAIYSRDDLTINGSGSLTIETIFKHGIVCNDDLVICDAKLDISAATDGIHANDSARFHGADITIDAGDDGVTVSNDEGSGYIYHQSGSMNILRCYEGLEAVTVTIDGGDINIRSSDDGINANGRGESAIYINGGNISIINETGRDADGLDSNGDIFINGGNLFISLVAYGGNCAIDYGSEYGGQCYINGGTVIACGSGTMLEEMSAQSGQCSVLYGTGSTVAGGNTLSLSDADGNVLAEATVPCDFAAVIISTPDMRLGGTYTVTAGELSETFTADTVNASCGSVSTGMFGGMGGMGGRPGGWGNFGGGNWPGMGNRDEGQPGTDFDGQHPDGDFDGQRPGRGGGGHGDFGGVPGGSDGQAPGGSDFSGGFDPGQFGDFDPDRSGTEGGH